MTILSRPQTTNGEADKGSNPPQDLPEESTGACNLPEINPRLGFTSLGTHPCIWARPQEPKEISEKMDFNQIKATSTRASSGLVVMDPRDIRNKTPETSPASYARISVDKLVAPPGSPGQRRLAPRQSCNFGVLRARNPRKKRLSRRQGLLRRPFRGGGRLNLASSCAKCPTSLEPPIARARALNAKKKDFRADKAFCDGRFGGAAP